VGTTLVAAIMNRLPKRYLDFEASNMAYDDKVAAVVLTVQWFATQGSYKTKRKNNEDS
jgi:hypothetical protein